MGWRRGDLRGHAGPGPLPPLALWTRGTKDKQGTALCCHLFGVVTISQTLSFMGDIRLPHRHSPEPRLSWCGSQEAVLLGGPQSLSWPGTLMQDTTCKALAGLLSVGWDVVRQLACLCTHWGLSNDPRLGFQSSMRSILF